MKAYLHVGNEKTGTTSLQRYFATQIGGSGLYYPKTGRGGGDQHRQLFDDLANGRDVSKFVDEVEGKAAILISSEAFSFMNEHADTAFANFSRLGFDVHMICVVREARDFLPALYMEGLKFGRTETYPEFLQKHLPRLETQRLKKTATKNGWKATFIPYSANTLLSDFRSCIPELPQTGSLPYVNTTPPKNMAPLLLDMNRVFKDGSITRRTAHLMMKHGFGTQSPNQLSIPAEIAEKINQIEATDEVRLGLFKHKSRRGNLPIFNGVRP